MKKSIAILLAAVTTLSLCGADIFLAGDSTCASYSTKLAPLTGWGQVLGKFCKKGVKIHNHARSGASTKTYIESKLWAKLLAKVKKGDYVVIQFGHNDSHKYNKKQYTAPGTTYDANLKKFIEEVRAKGGRPVIASSIARGIFNKKGVVALGSLAHYCNAAEKVAKARKVPFVDVNAETVRLFNKLGKKESLKLFMCSTGLPKRKNDVTHLNKKGADAVAKLFVDAVKKQKLPMAECFK